MNQLKINLLLSDPFKNPRGEVLLIPHFQDGEAGNELFNKVDRLLSNKLIKRAKKFGFESKKGDSFVVHDTEERIGFDAIMVIGLGKRANIKISDVRTSVAVNLRQVAGLKFNSVALTVDNHFKDDFLNLGIAFAEALYLSQYRFDKYRSKEEIEKTGKVTEMNLYLLEDGGRNTEERRKKLETGIEIGKIIAEGVNYVRDLVNEPAQSVYPEIIAKEAQKIAKESKGTISVNILSRQECEKLGMGAFLAVAQGSDREPQFIILNYKGNRINRRNRGRKFCLIGKTITFDSGGLSLKPSKLMETMKLDMAGGATVLGVFKVLGNLSYLSNLGNREVFGILPACENMPSGRAIRPGDIVRALNGKTIEILNTDAEGRLILADGLSYAEKYLKPDYIIDIATLTGAIMVALGPDLTGVFGNSRTLKKQILDAADITGEEAWHMPLYKPYLKKMKSEVADLKNISGTGYGGAITAALFLSEFVKKTKWVHLDIAGASFNGGDVNGIIPKGGTGWGVRTLVEFLQKA